MALTAFRRFQTKSEDLNRVQDNIAQTFRQILIKSILDGTLISGTFSTSGPIAFNHNLGRLPFGWIIVDIDSPRMVWRTSWDENTITLGAIDHNSAYAAANFSAWVF